MKSSADTIFRMQPAVFHNERKEFVPSCSYAFWRRGFDILARTDGATPRSVAEACAFSYGMVVRYALALSSTGGRVTAFTGNSFASLVALTTLRNLVSSGAIGTVIVLEDPAGPVVDCLKALQSRGVQLLRWNTNSWAHLAPIVEGSHNVLSGFFELGRETDSLRTIFIDAMNESPIPVHSVGVPAGLHPDNGAVNGTALYSSSTLSLGLPLAGLSKDETSVGRHYLCDLTWPLELYRENGYEGEPLFAEQPIIRVHAAV